jgi:hypothetical protein
MIDGFITKAVFRGDKKADNDEIIIKHLCVSVLRFQNNILLQRQAAMHCPNSKSQ